MIGLCCINKFAVLELRISKSVCNWLSVSNSTYIYLFPLILLAAETHLIVKVC